MSKFLDYTSRKLGIVGLNTEFRLCHIPFLVVNDVYGALALQGSSGTGKTTIIKRLGQLNSLAGGGRFGVFSADKARYEDFVGCPIPNANSGEMQIYPMPNSIAQMELILVDEINRATYENQEKWLSLIATRVVDSFPTKVKYIFTAMNPVLSDKDSYDVYEGVQPLDKALGERMLGLIEIPSLGDIKDRQDRVDIIKATIDQVNWTPTEELVELHKEFLYTARNIYEDLKAQVVEQVADYIDLIQNSLRTETKKAVSIEARRAQYILTNILAVHALDKTYNKNAKLENSALSGLLLSFPNPLWEQPINRQALKIAHEEAKTLLNINISEKQKHLYKSDTLDKVVFDLQKLIESGAKKEKLSKAINMAWPDVALDPINHYIYAMAVYSALSKRTTKGKNNLVKEQEFSRFEKVIKEIENTNSFKNLEKIRTHLSNNRNSNSIPADGYLPKYILEHDNIEEAKKNFFSILNPAISPYLFAIAEFETVNIENFSDMELLLSKFVDLMNKVRELNDQVS